MLSDQDLEMTRIDDDHWLVRDRRYPPSDARHVVACVTESEDGFDVVWLDPAVPLPMRYRDRDEVVGELARWRARQGSATRPVKIHARPPFAISRTRRAI